MTYSVKNCILCNENDLKNPERVSDGSNLRIEIRSCTTLQGAQLLVNEIGEEHLGILNFASAKKSWWCISKWCTSSRRINLSNIFLVSLTHIKSISRMIYSPWITIIQSKTNQFGGSFIKILFRMTMECIDLVHIMRQLSHVLHSMLILFVIEFSFKIQCENGLKEF